MYQHAKSFFAGLALFLVASSAQSQTISTEAPSVSAGGTTVDQGVFQIESALATNIWIDNLFNLRQFAVPNVLFRYGLANHLEARLSTGGSLTQSSWTETTSSSFGMANNSLGLKYQFVDLEKVDLSLIAQYNFPGLYRSNNEFVSTKDHGPSGIVTFSYQLKEGHSLGANLGGTFITEKEENFTDSNGNSIEARNNILTFNSSAVYSFMFLPKWTLFGEVFTSSQRYSMIVAGEPINQNEFSTDFGADAGALYLLQDNIQLDLALGYRFSSETFFGSLGFNIMF